MKKQTNRRPVRASLTTSLIAMSMLLSGCSTRPNTQSKIPISRSDLYFDTMVTITLYDYSGNSDTILDGCMDICDQYENLLSSTVEGSDVWNINHADAHPVEINKDTFSLMEKAIYYCELSEGSLDITLGGVSALWDFTGSIDDTPNAIPSKASLTEACKHVNYRNVKLEHQADSTSYYATLTDPDASVELGFIAKGFIADKLDEYMRDVKVTSAIINLGGNIKTIGAKPDGSPFKIGIQKPFGDMNESIVTIASSNDSIVSSGIYERYFKYQDQIYHHILDSQTGYPINSNILGVSIRTNNSTDADALSTLCYIYGIDKGLSYIESLPNTEAMYITDTYEIITSSNW